MRLGSRIKPNHHNQVALVQIPDKNCGYVFLNRWVAIKYSPLSQRTKNCFVAGNIAIKRQFQAENVTVAFISAFVTVLRSW